MIDMAKVDFSIVVTCHNQEEYIREAIDSVLEQTCSAKEIVVVDDCSTDQSTKILEQYGDSIKLVALPQNLGAPKARNVGAAAASGDYIAFLDGDDAYMPWALEIYDRVISEKRPAILIGDLRWVQKTIPPLSKVEIPAGIKCIDYQSFLAKDRGFGLSASSYVVAKDSFHAVQGWSPEIFQLDLQDLSLKLGCSGHFVAICEPPTVFYRYHGANSIAWVAPFIENACALIGKENAGKYPGGSAKRVQRYASLGGLIAFWIKRGISAGEYAATLKMAASGWLMVLTAIFVRLGILVKGKRPIEEFELYKGQTVRPS
jgi:glycosyltransferase involved in cell wall biosynthesis